MNSGRIEEGFYVLENVVVRLQYGICCRPAVAIIKDSLQYQNKIILVNPKEKTQASTRECMQLLSLMANHGVDLTIKVEDLPGTDPKGIAERYAKALGTSGFNPVFPNGGAE